VEFPWILVFAIDAAVGFFTALGVLKLTTIGSALSAGALGGVAGVIVNYVFTQVFQVFISLVAIMMSVESGNAFVVLVSLIGLIVSAFSAGAAIAIAKPLGLFNRFEP
jgi:hypothetical protein